MKINKLLIIVVAFTMTTKSFAQVKYGIKAGLNLANMLEKDDDDTYSDDYLMKIGFHLGGTAEIPISEKFSVQPGLLFSTKGFKMKIDGIDGFYEAMNINVNLNYLEIPINAIYKIELGSSKLCINAGPYLGYALSGIVSVDDDSESIDIGSSDDDDLKALDYGFNIGAGIEINDAITIGLQYGLGLGNLSIDTDNGYKLNNRVIGISVGYMFGQ